MRFPSPPRLLRLFAFSVAAGLAIVSATGCLQQNAAVSGKPLRTAESAKLGPFIHYQDGPTLFLGVDLRAAQYVKDDTIFPVGIGLANQSRSPLTFNLEAFTLEDSEGNQYPPVGLQEFNAYKRSRADARLAENFIAILATRFENYTPARWTPYPFSGSNAGVQGTIELQRLFWTAAYVYFPVPETGLHDKRFTLLVRPDPVDETFVVRFRVP